ncbi:MAG: nucleoside monophosphate kinase [Candidatus Melainabacteria bacterium]|nr:nucleoside monophosphate kinase [Candidatus Melainabacteria bacterium]
MKKLPLSVRWQMLTNDLIRNHARYILRRHPNKKHGALLGGPGSGKGTLVVRLGPATGLNPLGMGDVLRREDIQKEYGDRLAAMSKGGLLPDPLVHEILERELKLPAYTAGAIFDGIPRTLRQALLLERTLAWQGISLDWVFLLEFDDEELVERLTHRRTCPNPNCRRTYHLKYSPPAVANVCDACKGPLIQRKDDVPEVIRERLRKYHEEIVPLRAFYRARGVLVEVKPPQGSTPQTVFDTVIQHLKRKAQA